MLGAATSGVTLFRGIGGSLGAAVFGTIFSSRLASRLRGPAERPGRATSCRAGGRLTGAQVARLPAAPARSAYEHAYVHALQPGVSRRRRGRRGARLRAELAAARAPLRDTAATSRGLDDSLAAPRSPDSLAEIERALARAPRPSPRRQFRERVAERAVVDLSPGATWALVRISEHGLARARRFAEQDGVPPERIATVVDELRSGASSAETARPDSPPTAARSPSAQSRPGASCSATRSPTRPPTATHVSTRSCGGSRRSSRGSHPSSGPSDNFLRALSRPFVLTPTRAQLRREHDRPCDSDDQH